MHSAAMQLAAIKYFTRFLFQKSSIAKALPFLRHPRYRWLGSIALPSLGVMYVLKKAEKLAEKVDERMAKYLHVASSLALEASLRVMSVLKKAWKLVERDVMSVLKQAGKVIEKLAANQEETQMHFRRDCVESASLQSPACQNHRTSVNLWTSVNLQQPQVHTKVQPSTF